MEGLHLDVREIFKVCVVTLLLSVFYGQSSGHNLPQDPCYTLCVNMEENEHPCKYGGGGTSSTSKETMGQVHTTTKILPTNQPGVEQAMPCNRVWEILRSCSNLQDSLLQAISKNDKRQRKDFCATPNKIIFHSLLFQLITMFLDMFITL